MTSAPPLRRILLRSIVAVNLLAVLVLAVPLGAAVASTYRAEAEAALEQEATRVLALTQESGFGTLPDPLDPAVRIGIYDSTGGLVSGSGPSTDSDAEGALANGVTRVVDEAEGWLAVYVPFSHEGGSPVTIRAATPASTVQGRVWRAWGMLAALAVVSMAAAAGFAVRRSRALAAPFERLAVAAHDLRMGAFALSIPATGVREGDDVARTLETAARRAAERVDAAHSLAEDASHQVRTPIAAARLTLESALAIPGSDLGHAASTAVEQLDRATDALSEVLDLRRLPPSDLPAGPAAATVRDSVARWSRVLATTGRTCTLVADDLPPGTQVPQAVLRQVLDVLLDNSVAHGAGPLVVEARLAGDWLLVDVCDAGSVDLTPEQIFQRGQGRGTGLGLPLARSLAESVGGQLVLADPAPTRFTLALPTTEAE